MSSHSGNPTSDDVASSGAQLARRTVRPLVRADIAALQVIDDDAHGHAWSQRTFEDDVDRNDRLHLVAVVNDQIVGHASAWLDGASCRITNVAVAVDQHGFGHATVLLLAVIEQVLATNRAANMQLEVRPSNRRAQRLYSRFGFVPVGIERNFYDHLDGQGSTDALVMAIADLCAEPWRERLAALTSEVEQSTNTNDAGAAA